eukprot:7308825-Prymnesium_polylepis.1
MKPPATTHGRQRRTCCREPGWKRTAGDGTSESGGGGGERTSAVGAMSNLVSTLLVPYAYFWPLEKAAHTNAKRGAAGTSPCQMRVSEREGLSLIHISEPTRRS